MEMEGKGINAELSSTEGFIVPIRRLSKLSSQ